MNIISRRVRGTRVDIKRQITCFYEDSAPARRIKSLLRRPSAIPGCFLLAVGLQCMLWHTYHYLTHGTARSYCMMTDERPGSCLGTIIVPTMWLLQNTVTSNILSNGTVSGLCQRPASALSKDHGSESEAGGG